MNFLAHALLSEPYAHSLIGNLGGDFVKGPLRSQELHPRVLDGVRRHRRIDALTDVHPGYAELRPLFLPAQRRYAGVVLDVLLDHVLWRSWPRFSSWDRECFVDGTYEVLLRHESLQPESFRRVSRRMIEADWLRAGSSLSGVERALGRAGRRARRPVDLGLALERVADQPGVQEVLLGVFASVQACLEDVRP